MKTITSLTHPTQLTKESVHSKIGTGNYLKHTFTKDTVNFFEENIGKVEIELSQEQANLGGDFMRAQSFAIQHIDQNQKSYLKRLKESELADLNKTMRKLTVQLDSYGNRAKMVYMPKDVNRLIDMMTTFGGTIKQVELYLKEHQRKLKGEIRTSPGREKGDALTEFEADLDFTHEAARFVDKVEKNRGRVAAFRDSFYRENGVQGFKPTSAGTGKVCNANEQSW